MPRVGALFLLVFVVTLEPLSAAARYQSSWPDGVSRVWIGPDFWANRLQDWRIRLGRLGTLDQDHPADGNSWSGFLAGASHGKLNYRAAALVHHFGGAGYLIFRGNEQDRPVGEYPLLAKSEQPINRNIWEDIRLQLDAHPKADGVLDLTLTALDMLRKTIIANVTLTGFPEERLRGGLALVSQMTAQMPPLGSSDTRGVRLYTQPDGATESMLATTADIVEPGYTAHFRVEGWDSATRHTFVGTIRKDPVEKTEIVVAGFTGNQVMGKPADGSWGENRFGSERGHWTPENLWFPHSQMLDALSKHDVDLLVFTGDQIYEGGNPTNSDHRERNPEMDYLYKWFLRHWAYSPVVRTLPSVHLVDDHDVYQGDLWGGGARTLNGNNKDGGYPHEPGFVRMVERTQCAHNPDPHDSRPIRGGIGVYYGAFRYGEIGFAIIEDRKFKSLPTIVEGIEREESAIGNSKITPLDVLRANEEIYSARDYHVLLDREMNADGYGIVRLNKPEQRITIEAWPWDGNGQIKDWPITVELSDLYGRKAAAWLPTLEIEGQPDAVVQIVEESSGEIIYTTRARDGRFRPKVFRQGSYTVRVGEPGTGRMREFTGIQSVREPDNAILAVPIG